MYLLDTNILIEIVKRHPNANVVRRFDVANIAYAARGISPIVVQGPFPTQALGAAPRYWAVTSAWPAVG